MGILESTLSSIPDRGSAALTNDELGIHDDAPGGLDSVFDQVDQGFHRLGAKLCDRLPDGGELEIHQ